MATAKTKTAAKATPKGKGAPAVRAATPSLVATPKRGKRRLHIRAELADGGSLHVRHLKDDLYAMPGVEIDAALMRGVDAPSKMVWNQLAKPGVFRGHKAGAFELNERIFSEIIRNFKNDGQPVPVDFEHSSELPANEGSIPTEGAPAQGWIHDMKIVNGNLFGLVEWGDLAREYIETKKYKFFSPAIRFGAKDRVTGEPIGARMSSGGMTNNPYLVQMMPLVASDAAANAGSESTVLASRIASMGVADMNSFAARLRACLRLNELASMAECSDQLGRLRDLYEAAPHARAMHLGVDLAGFTDGL